MSANPLLEAQGLPQFSRIQPEMVKPAVEKVLMLSREKLEAICEKEKSTWSEVISPLDDLMEQLGRTWSPVRHLNSVLNTEALHVVYNACLPLISEYQTELGQNRALFDAVARVQNHSGAADYDQSQKQVLKNMIRDFRLSGIDLPEKDQQRYKEISQRLAELASIFEKNLLDATHAWEKLVQDETQLAGLPESALEAAQEKARSKGEKGWLFTLEFPSYFALVTYAQNRELRKEIYTAYTTRASDQGPCAGEWDNLPVMEEILALRQESAQLLGFSNYAALSLATKMAESVDQVMNFLYDLAARSYDRAKQELEALEEFARQADGIEQLEAWDVSFYSEKLRKERYDINQEELRAWFPKPKVLAGLFGLIEKLFGVVLHQIDDIDIWHPDVEFYEIRDFDGQLRGQLYLDLYARGRKRGGAWMDDLIGRRRKGDDIQTPVAFVVCNFAPPVGNKPALLTHSDVTTLFHEFGHALHHLLTRVDWLPVSGINGVAWDAVELPSQFMENWCWEREVIDLISEHVDTRETLPDDLFKKMVAARNFQSAMQMVRQLEFALFDFRLHSEFDPETGPCIEETLREVREQVAVVKPPEFNRFANGFSHIFAGGYAAGYYSYKWAEVLSADVFARFEEEGLFNADIGRKYLTAILERGGSDDAMTLFKDFRGREPEIDALLRHSGLLDK